MDINTKILEDLGLYNAFKEYMFDGKDAVKSVDDFLSKQGGNFTELYTKKMSEPASTGIGGEQKSENAQGTDEVVIEGTPNDNNGAATNDNAGWVGGEKVPEVPSGYKEKTMKDENGQRRGYLYDDDNGNKFYIETKGKNNYRLVTQNKEGGYRKPTLDEMKAFVAALPPNNRINLGNDLSPEFKALFIEAMGNDASKRIAGYKEIMQNEDVKKAYDIISKDQREGEEKLENAEQPQGQNKLEEQTAEEPTPNTASDQTSTPDQNESKPESKPEIIYTVDDLTQSAKKAYDKWLDEVAGHSSAKNPNNGHWIGTPNDVNAFLESEYGKGYKQQIENIKQNGPTSRWKAVWKARKEYKTAKKDYKKNEGFVQDLLVAHANAEFLSMRKGQLADAKILTSQINALEENHPEKFGKYRKIFEGEMYKNMNDEQKKEYRNKDYEAKTYEIKEYMRKELVGEDEDGKGGYLSKETADKPTWRNEYKKIRDDEKPIRKARRKAKRKKIKDGLINAGKATLMFAGKVAKWPFDMAERTLVASWKGAQYVYNSITNIPNKVRKNREARREKKMDKLIDKYNNNEKDRTAKQILRLQGRINAGKGGKIVGLNTRVDIRNEVRRSDKEVRKDNVADIIKARGGR